MLLRGPKYAKGGDMNKPQSDAIKAFFTRDKFAKYCGIELLEVSEGRAKARMKLTENHLNGLAMAHGGAVFTLADLVFAVACNSHGQVAVAVNVNISFLKAAAEGQTLTAEGFENDKNRRLGSYTVNVTNDAGELIAVFQGMAYRKKERIDEV